MRGFNIDLLKIESINSNQEYYNLLCSYGLLPQIIQPTRVVENQSPSLIDNIFTNNISDKITGGNIYLTFSEHFQNIFPNLYLSREKKWTTYHKMCLLEIMLISLLKSFEMIFLYKIG